MQPTTRVRQRDSCPASLRMVIPLVAWLFLPLGGCQEGAPTVVNRGEPIALGLFAVSVSQVESLSASFLEEALQAPPGSSFLAVRLRVDWGSSDRESRSVLPRPLDELVFDLMTGLTLEDGEGERYRRPLPLHSTAYRMMRSTGSMSTMTPQDLDILFRSDSSSRLPTDWVVVFSVSDDAQDFQLLIRNREARDDQPRRVAVALGR